MLYNVDIEQQYGSSSSVCDYILRHQLKEILPLQIVDFGAGGGKNGKIAREILGGHVKLIAVEGCEKTAQMLSIQGIYDVVYHSLIQKSIFKDEYLRTLTSNDLSIFGDVLEHLTPMEIHVVIKQCLRIFKKIIVICPLHEIFQDASYGNQLEVHKTYITSNFFDRYNIVEKHILQDKEYTIMNLCIQSSAESEPMYKKLSGFMFHRAVLILQPIGLARPFVNILKRYALSYKWLIRRR